MHRWLRRFLFTLGSLGLLLAIFHLIENWRGQRAWAAWKASREAKGDRYGWPPEPPPIPDTQNFAAVPRVAAAVRVKDAVPLLGDFQMPSDPAGSGSWREGQRLDLAGFAAALNAPDVAQGLAPVEAALDELVEASRRPGCRITVDYRHGEIPGLLGFRAAGRALRLRALDRLAKGHTAEAREDVLAILRVANHVGSDPVLIASLLQMALVDFAVQPMWEGLQDHRWSEADLVAFQEALGSLDLLDRLSRAWHTERLMVSTPALGGIGWLVDQSAWTRAGELASAGIWMGSAPTSPAPSRWKVLAFWALVPKGWIYQNMVVMDRLWAEGVEPILDPPTHRFLPLAPGVEARITLATSGFHPYQMLAALAMPALLGQNQRAALKQVGLDQARVACALERYRLTHKAYPEALDPLLAEKLLAAVPEDVPAGGPLRYRRQGEGYYLWSLGSNRTDEEGGRTIQRDDDGRIKLDQGDWVWTIAGVRP